MKQALLLIDIQNDYFPGGAMELVGAAAAGRQAGKLLEAFRQKARPVIHVRHLSTRQGASFFLPQTWGAQIHDCVTPRTGETVFEKHYPNSFRETALLEHLRHHEISELVVAGMMTQMCIDTTVRAASDLGFHCLLAADACAARPLSFGADTVSAEDVQTAFLAALEGLFAKVLPVESICAGLRGFAARRPDVPAAEPAQRRGCALGSQRYRKADRSLHTSKGGRAMTTEADRHSRGLENLRTVDAKAGERVIESLADIAPDLGRYIVDFAFGEIYARPGLDFKARQIATVAALTALGNAEPQLKVHINGALNVGLSRDEVIEVIMHVAVYAGFPAALNGVFAAREVFAERDAEGQSA